MAGGFQPRQVALDQQPDADNINAFIIMPQPVPQVPDFPSWDGRIEIGGKVAKFRGRLADDQQAVFDGADHLIGDSKTA